MHWLEYARCLNTDPIARKQHGHSMKRLNVLKYDAADAVQLDPRFDGGVWGFRLLREWLKLRGSSAVAHSFGELGSRPLS